MKPIYLFLMIQAPFCYTSQQPPHPIDLEPAAVTGSWIVQDKLHPPHYHFSHNYTNTAKQLPPTRPPSYINAITSNQHKTPPPSYAEAIAQTQHKTSSTSDGEAIIAQPNLETPSQPADEMQQPDHAENTFSSEKQQAILLLLVDN